MLRFILILILYFTTIALKANDQCSELSSVEISSLVQEQNLVFQFSDTLATPAIKYLRVKAILFTIFTGFLGGHRIYLGTHHRTPIIYSLTFGGLGILPLIDLVHLIFTEDLSIYQDKSQIIMWKK
jgi:hypothetical protein